jgi:hypothetical protein
MDKEFNRISHVRTTVEIMYGLSSKNSVRNCYLLIIESKKYGSQYVHFFYNHLKSINKNGRRGIKSDHVCIARRQNL